MSKLENFKDIFEDIVYIITCVVTLGLVYLIRIIITKGVILALYRRDSFIQEQKFEKLKSIK